MKDKNYFSLWPKQLGVSITSQPSKSYIKRGILKAVNCLVYNDLKGLDVIDTPVLAFEKNSSLYNIRSGSAHVTLNFRIYRQNILNFLIFFSELKLVSKGFKRSQYMYW